MWWIYVGFNSIQNFSWKLCDVRHNHTERSRKSRTFTEMIFESGHVTPDPAPIQQLAVCHKIIPDLALAESLFLYHKPNLYSQHYPRSAFKTLIRGLNRKTFLIRLST